MLRHVAMRRLGFQVDGSIRSDHIVVARGAALSSLSRPVDFLSQAMNFLQVVNLVGLIELFKIVLHL